MKYFICVFQRETKESRAERLNHVTNHVTNEEQKMKGGRRRQKEESAVNRKRRKGKPKVKDLISGETHLLSGLC